MVGVAKRLAPSSAATGCAIRLATRTATNDRSPARRMQAPTRTAHVRSVRETRPPAGSGAQGADFAPSGMDLRGSAFALMAGSDRFMLEALETRAIHQAAGQ